MPVYVQQDRAQARTEASSCLPRSPTTSCWDTACPPSGSTTCARRTRTALVWQTICRRRPPRHCSSWPRAANHAMAADRRRRLANPFEHPDAQRRFRVMTNSRSCERALDFPWEKWTVFLHPEQRQWVERDYAGPARVSGSAGTGKTIVALHRAVHLARTHPEARVLLATFSDTLAHALQAKLRRLIGNEPRLAERIDVHSLDAVGLRLHKMHCAARRISRVAKT